MPDKQKINTAESFEELALVGLEALEKMRLSGREIVQICGPISTGGLGSIEKNIERFERAIEKAIEKGLHVFNQAPFEDAMKRLSVKYPKVDGYCVAILEVFYRKIFESGHVSRTLFLPGWESSKGATWERKLVSGLGIAVEEYPMEWINEIENNN
ncbi:DUF4406 domain-containing protein [Candidatus Nomurabacteria bacterium]|nr:DUF4406 domain-containing protein [Candidatus Nomurabacteria bacterium]